MTVTVTGTFTIAIIPIFVIRVRRELMFSNLFSNIAPTITVNSPGPSPFATGNNSVLINVTVTDDSASVYNTSFEYGLSLPIDYNDNSIQISPIVRGFGFATDIGITYLRTTKGHQNFTYGRICESPYEPYNYKIGFAIQDLGFIKFKKKL